MSEIGRDKKYILTGNYQQYENYLREFKKSPMKSVYISDPKVIYGIARPNVIRYGTWYLRRDIDEIEEILSICWFSNSTGLAGDETEGESDE